MPTFERVTESTNQPVTSMLTSSPSRQRSLTLGPAKVARLAVTWVIGPMVPLHHAR